MPGLAAGPKLPGQGPLAPFQAAAFAAGGPGALPPMQPMPMLDDHGGASVGGIGGPIGQLLDQNLAYLNQFRTNMQCFKVTPSGFGHNLQTAHLLGYALLCDPSQECINSEISFCPRGLPVRTCSRATHGASRCAWH